MPKSVQWWQRPLPSWPLPNRFIAERQSLLGADLAAIREGLDRIFAEMKSPTMDVTVGKPEDKPL